MFLKSDIIVSQKSLDAFMHDSILKQVLIQVRSLSFWNINGSLNGKMDYAWLACYALVCNMDLMVQV